MASYYGPALAAESLSQALGGIFRGMLENEKGTPQLQSQLAQLNQLRMNQMLQQAQLPGQVEQQQLQGAKLRQEMEFAPARERRAEEELGLRGQELGLRGRQVDLEGRRVDLEGRRVEQAEEDLGLKRSAEERAWAKLPYEVQQLEDLAGLHRAHGDEYRAKILEQQAAATRNAWLQSKIQELGPLKSSNVMDYIGLLSTADPKSGLAALARIASVRPPTPTLFTLLQKDRSTWSEAEKAYVQNLEATRQSEVAQANAQVSLAKARADLVRKRMETLGKPTPANEAQQARLDADVVQRAYKAAETLVTNTYKGITGFADFSSLPGKTDMEKQEVLQYYTVRMQRELLQNQGLHRLMPQLPQLPKALQEEPAGRTWAQTFDAMARGFYGMFGKQLPSASPESKSEKKPRAMSPELEAFKATLPPGATIEPLDKDEDDDDD